MNLENYNYKLPSELIAQEAFHPRDKCKLLILDKKGNIEHKIFSEIVDELNSGDVLVLNETKVQRCKLAGKKETGGAVEITLIKKLKRDKNNNWYKNNKLDKNNNLTHNLYETRIKGSNLKIGSKLLFPKNKAIIVQRKEDVFYLQFEKELQEEELELLTPPYIKKNVPEEDYQTVFAKITGSLAAPTAGLHFTPELLSQIEKKGVKIAKLQLDISFETFLPVRDVDNHKTGKEYFIVDEKNAQIINDCLTKEGRLLAVGTTVVKCLESCVWQKGKLIPTKGNSEIFLKPGYPFKAPISGMLTNFHLPKSSLLLLTAAFIGREKLLNAYEEAVQQKYRFFSLGDAMLIWR